MIGVTLRHLRYFDALARHGHFGRAAEECAISQPAISVQIKELETILGAPLVERTARRVRLTTLGEDLLVRARKVLLEIDEIGHLVRAPGDPLSGRLRLGIIPTVAPYLLPEMMAVLTRSFPAVELQPRETMTQTLIQDLVQSRLDACIVALPISEPSLDEFVLFEEDFVLVRPIDDRMKPVPSASNLGKMRLLLLEEGHCFRDQALSFCEVTRSPPAYMMEGSSLSTLVQMVGAGMGVTLIPEMALGLEMRASNVSIARFDSPPPSRTIGMIWRKTSPLIDQLKQIGSTIEDVGRSRLDAIRRDHPFSR